MTGHSMGWGGVMGTHSMGMVGKSFAAVPMSRAALAPHVSHAFVPHHAIFHHRFNRFISYGGGGPYYYDDCSRQVWTRFGLQWVNVCYTNYNYGY